MHNRNDQRDHRLIDSSRINGAVDISKDAVSSARIWVQVSDLRHPDDAELVGELATQLSIADEAMKKALRASQQLLEAALISRQ